VSYNAGFTWWSVLGPGLVGAPILDGAKIKCWNK